MKNVKNLFIALSIVMVLLISAAPAYSSGNMLPWLNFGNHLIWDSNNNTLTNDPSTYVTSATYLDNTTVNAYSGDPALGTYSLSPFILYPVTVNLSISYNGIADDYLQLVATDGSGITWLYADLDVSGPVPDPVGSPNTLEEFLIKSNGLSVASGSGSLWADEFSSTINPSAAHPAALNIALSGVSNNQGSGMYQLNAFSKVAVVPEPVSTVLFIVGGITLAVRRCVKKKEVRGER